MDEGKEPTVIENTGEVATFSHDITPVNRQRMYQHPIFKDVYTANNGVPPHSLFSTAFAVGLTLQRVKELLMPFPISKPTPIPPAKFTPVEVTLCDAEWVEDQNGKIADGIYFGQAPDEQGHTQCRKTAVVEGTIKKSKHSACADHEAAFKRRTGGNWRVINQEWKQPEGGKA
jgi:hypothetical protein